MSSPLIVALDFESGKEAIDVVHRLGATADHYKVGLQLLTEAGPDLIRRLREMGKQVFLDLNCTRFQILSLAGSRPRESWALQ